MFSSSNGRKDTNVTKLCVCVCVCEREREREREREYLEICHKIIQTKRLVHFEDGLFEPTFLQTLHNLVDLTRVS